LIPVNRPKLEPIDVKAVIATLEDNWISGDSKPVKDLETNLASKLGTSQAICLTNGSAAIDVSIEALDLAQGAECIVPTFTIISTVSNLARSGAIIKLVDADPKTWCMNTEDALNELTENTRLIFPVHTYGLPVDMDPILSASQDKDIFVLEDAAEALGLKYREKYCGTIGDAGIFSFYANKIVTGGEGGAVISNNNEFANRIRYLKNLCFEDERYVHRELGWNLRMPALSASMINSQLERLDHLALKKRDIGLLYRELLKGHPWLSFQEDVTDYAVNNYWVFGILLNPDCPFNAKELQTKLLSMGIETRRFFCPMHLQPALKSVIAQAGKKYPVSENLWYRGLYLPSGLGNTESEFQQVSEVLWGLVN
jgi:perosamine synthetase